MQPIHFVLIALGLALLVMFKLRLDTSKMRQKLVHIRQMQADAIEQLNALENRIRGRAQ